MNIHLGADTAVEAGTGRAIDGEQVTTFTLPDDTSFAEIVTTIEATIGHHMTGSPAWVDCDDSAVRALLCDYFSIPKTRKRPAAWGKGA